MKVEEVREVLRTLHCLGINGYQDYLRAKEGLKIGLIVNPIAGMGGRVGLKGTDGVVDEAIRLGAKPVSPQRAVRTLRKIHNLRRAFQLITCPGEMGEVEALEAGFEPELISMKQKQKSKTSPDDTVRAASELSEIPVNLILFVGGDGTARDILRGLKNNVPILGVPSGVKMYSGVFAFNPEACAGVIEKFTRVGLPLRMAEVMDIDEEEFRKGRLTAKLFGYALTPYDPELVQSEKVATHADELGNQYEIAKYVSELMDSKTVYILCPGSTVYAVARIMGIDKSLLGVDIVQNGEIIAKDADEKKILSTIRGKRAKIIVTPIGGQGFIFGRGNQQISPGVIREVGRENIIVISTRNKLSKIKLRVDTGDEELDRELRGKIRVITGYKEERVVEVL